MSRNCVLKLLGLPKTIFFNLRCLPLSQAIKIPVFVSHRVWLMDLSGRVIIMGPVRTGMIEIGFGEVGIFDRDRSRTIWQVSGYVEFNGAASIGHGSKISVSGVLRLGDNFTITAESSIVAKKSVSFGNNALISWDALIMDTDFHRILDIDGVHINPDATVVIGNNVWIGCRTLVLRGASIADGVVVAAASVVHGHAGVENSVIGGSPAKTLREGISWRRY